MTARAGLTARLFCCLAIKYRDLTVIAKEIKYRDLTVIITMMIIIMKFLSMIQRIWS